ncbi:MAG: hypothetical protein R2825_11910 [Saprospiraceae bacterium]
MKTFLHLALFLFTIALQGQVTIDQSNFLRGTTYTDTLANAMPSTLGTHRVKAPIKFGITRPWWQQTLSMRNILA